MPRGDRTGPEGKGPRTGRGLGDCSTGTNVGSQIPKGKQGTKINYTLGRGQGQEGRGRSTGNSRRGRR